MERLTFNNILVTFSFAFLFFACRHDPESLNETRNEGPEFMKDTIITGSFPDFITPTTTFYVFSNNPIPQIKADEYRLKVFGAVEQEKSFTLDELLKRKMISKTATIECIGNLVNGDMIGNALWTGISIYDLINELGLKPGVTGVKYICRDGYFMTNTIEEISNNSVIGALYMNQEPLPVNYGFPLKIIFPGYHGVRQPGWVTEIEVLDKDAPDYWSGSSWKAKSPIGVDSKIFYPSKQIQIPLGKTIQFGGAAFGAKRISKVELTMDGGNSWNLAQIIKQSQEDYVWVFWKYNFKPETQGDYWVRVRATDEDGNVQIKDDNDHRDGDNSWPTVIVNVK